MNFLTPDHIFLCLMCIHYHPPFIFSLMQIISTMMAQEPKKNKNKKSLNPQAPAYFPAAKQNLNPLIHGYFQNYPPSPYLETYTAPIFPRCSFYTSPPYPSTSAQQVVLQQPHAGAMALLNEPAAAAQQPDEAQSGTGERVAAARGGGHRNRVFSRRSNYKGGQEFKQLQWRPKFHYFRNLQQKHPILPVRNYGNNTTVMIRNIPNRFTREMLMDFLDDHCMEENRKAVLVKEAFVSAFDFLYLPIDFKNRMNKGYAFVNFTDPRAVWKFYIAAHNKRWNVFQSNKIREIAYARVQGKEELVKRLQIIDFPCDKGKDQYLPVCFSPARDGSRKNVNQRTVGKCIGIRVSESPNNIIKSNQTS